MKIIDFEKLKNSFKFAFQGLKSAFSGQSFRIMFFCAALTVALMIVLRTSLPENIILILLITLVLSFELNNSLVEKILDVLRPDHDPKIKIIKDLSAAVITLFCAGALIIGILIFLPRILEIFR